VHKNGALASWQVGSNDEAVAAAKAGCDLIVAQGIEAGGHIRGKIGLLSLLEQVLDSVSVPVLAAGGIGSGRAMAAALAAGASGVRVGTRFIVAEEAEAHPQYQKALIHAEPEDTVVTEVFSENWPNAPHRVLRSSVEAAQAFKGGIVGQRRLASSGEMAPAKRFESITMTRDTTGTLEAMPHWAGESVASVEKVQPAAAIIDELMSEAERLLHSWK
jgi:NAD(P)H-dependent flavin oxidoreductase YrpB (nitropropane dioxygenase family)